MIYDLQVFQDKPVVITGQEDEWSYVVRIKLQKRVKYANRVMFA